jgi:hypothetical protein
MFILFTNWSLPHILLFCSVTHIRTAGGAGGEKRKGFGRAGDGIGVAHCPSDSLANAAITGVAQRVDGRQPQGFAQRRLVDGLVGALEFVAGQEGLRVNSMIRRTMFENDVTN